MPPTLDQTLLPILTTHRRPSPRVFGLSLLLVLGGCATAPAEGANSADRVAGTAAADSTSAPLATPATAPELQSPNAETQFHVLAGELAAGRNQPHVAAEEFLAALDTMPDKDLASRTTELAVKSGDEALSMTAARRWLALDSTALGAREIIIRLALRAGLNEEVYSQADRIIRDDAGGQDDGFHHVALLLAQEPEKAESALILMGRLVAAYPKLAGAYRAQSLLALRYNQLDLAEQAARDAIRLQPQSKESGLLLVGALVKKGRIDESDQLMDSITKDDANANDLREKYAQLLLQSDQSAHGREQLERILAKDPGDLDAHYLLGLLSLDEHKLPEAQSHFELLAKDHEHSEDAQYYLGRIAEAQQDPNGAIAHYEKVTSGAQALDAVMRRAAMMAKLGHVDDAQALLEQLRQQIPQFADRFALAEGELLLDAGATDKALLLYGSLLAESPDNADLLYSRSLVYERTGQIDLAEADLRKILEKSSDDARTLNALGYMLTVHSDHFDEAQKLIDRALQLTPDEPAVIDSQAWLLFRRGHPAEALPLLQKAYAAFPDAEVAAHLGEVLWALGDKDQARSVLARASHDDPSNIALRDTVKRLEQ